MSVAVSEGFSRHTPKGLTVWAFVHFTMAGTYSPFPVIPIFAQVNRTRSPALGVFTWLYFEERNKRATLIEISKNIQDPAEIKKILEQLQGKKEPINHRRSGTITLFVGIGLYLLGAVALGARILERHFTSDKSWPGPDIEISMDPKELQELIIGSNQISQALGGTKEVLKEEKPTIDFAYATVVTIDNIRKGEKFTEQNIWVKRPGTGEILAEKYNELLGKTSTSDLSNDVHLKWNDVSD